MIELSISISETRGRKYQKIDYAKANAKASIASKNQQISEYEAERSKNSQKERGDYQ
jgi:hypothetical protein